MPRYCFRLIGDGVLGGPIEVELPTVKEARTWGLQTLDEILRDEGMTFWDGTEWQMTVSDASGKCVLRLRFSADP
ncbi:DUF6894 family protein [Microvirga ossetica]|uniref:DUF6894 family protein n=1 Tax=Microvirga ossetica TaxID=1882682 RepID=UPI003AAB784A